MITPLSTLLLASLAYASPLLEVRTVTALDQAAFAEAQKRDATATQAFSNTAIKTGDGRCLFVDLLSGDFRANLNPIQVAACDGSMGQQWDIITKGVHDDQAGTMLIVNTLTQACAKFDPRRAAGNQVIMFSCGGRADGGGAVANSQLFPFTGDNGPLAFSPINDATVCLAVTSASVLDQAPCVAGDITQTFTFAAAADSASSSPVAAVATSAASVVANVSSVVAVRTRSIAFVAPSATPEGVSVTSVVDVLSSTNAGCASTTIVTVYNTIDVTSPLTLAQSTTSSSSAVVVTSAPPSSDANSTTPVPVSRAGGTLVPSAVAESQARDNTATRAFTAVTIKDSTGNCLSINPTAGDFRENLIPITVEACSGAAGQKFDFITAGSHNNAANSTLIVSSLMNGCLNIDVRRAAGDQVITFSCGGRADGQGATTSSQLFPFVAGTTSMALAPENQAGATCLFNNNGKLDQTACTGAAGQVFTFG